MENPNFPSFENFTTEELPVEHECTQIAFSLLNTYSTEQDICSADMLQKVYVTHRVDGLMRDEQDKHVAVRLHSSPRRPLPEDLPEDFEDGRTFAVTVLDVGTSEVEGVLDDTDFSWRESVAIIVETRSLFDIHDIFICDAQNGKELDDEQKAKLFALLWHMQKNLQIEYMPVAAHTLGIENQVEDVVDPEPEPLDAVFGLEFYDYNNCPTCWKPYATCDHRQYPLN